MSKARLTSPLTRFTSELSVPGALCSRVEAFPMRFIFSLSEKIKVELILAVYRFTLLCLYHPGSSIRLSEA